MAPKRTSSHPRAAIPPERVPELREEYERRRAIPDHPWHNEVDSFEAHIEYLNGQYERLVTSDPSDFVRVPPDQASAYLAHPALIPIMPPSKPPVYGVAQARADAERQQSRAKLPPAERRQRQT